MTDGLSASPELERFVAAQDGVYEAALAEIRAGRKRSHWMWFVFPQIDGLGFSATSKRFAVRSRAEAEAYVAHPVLGARLIECAQALLGLDRTSAEEIFGEVDALKLRSSATLFAAVSSEGSLFHRILERYFGGAQDERTLQLLQRSE